MTQPLSAIDILTKRQFRNATVLYLDTYIQRIKFHNLFIAVDFFEDS